MAPQELDDKASFFIQNVSSMVDFNKNSLYIVIDVEVIYFVFFSLMGNESIESCKVGELIDGEWLINQDETETWERTKNTLRLLTSPRKDFALENWIGSMTTEEDS